MPDIQEQIEQQIKDFASDCYRDELVFEEECADRMKSIIHSVVEECCKAAQGELQFWDIGSEVSPSVAKSINRHFAWLDEK